MEVYRVIVSGSRDFNDYEYLKKTLDQKLKNLKAPIVIVSGGARGADTLGERYAAERKYQIDKFPADWMRYGSRAGYIRNCKMAENANALIAFWDGQSRGTKHMIDTAKRCKLDVDVIKYSTLLHNKGAIKRRY